MGFEGEWLVPRVGTAENLACCLIKNSNENV
jgi:hypothetical protein